MRPVHFLIPLVLVGLISASLAQDPLQRTPLLPTATVVSMGISAGKSNRSNPSTEGLTTGTQRAEPTPPRPEVVLRKDSPVVFRLSGMVTSFSKPEPSPTLQVVQDLKVGEAVVVQRNSLIEFSVDRQSAGNGTDPGIVILEFKSVLSIAGNEIPLSGSEASAGERDEPVSCGGDLCLPNPFAFLLKGHEGKLPGDVLMAAYVKGDVAFDAAVIEKFNHELAAARQSSPKDTSTRARVHFYFNMLNPKQQHRDTITSLGVRIDGTKIGTLKPWHYACAEVTAGTHRLRVGKESSLITLKEGENFIRVQQDAANTVVTFREGYEIYDRPLLHGTFNKSFAVDCWNN